MLFNFTLSFPKPSCILGFSAPLPKLNFAVVSLWFNMNSCSIKKAEGEAAKC